MDFTPEQIAALCTGVVGVLVALVPIIRALRSTAAPVAEP